MYLLLFWETDNNQWRQGKTARDIATFGFKESFNKPLLEKLLPTSFAFCQRDMHCLWLRVIKFDLLPLNCKRTFPQMHWHLNLRTQQISVTSCINCEQLLAKQLMEYCNARFRKCNTSWALNHLQGLWLEVYHLDKMSSFNF